MRNLAASSFVVSAFASLRCLPHANFTQAAHTLYPHSESWVWSPCCLVGIYEGREQAGTETLLGTTRCPGQLPLLKSCPKSKAAETVCPLFGFIYIMTFNDDDNVWGMTWGGPSDFLLKGISFFGMPWKFCIDGLSFVWKLLWWGRLKRFFVWSRRVYYIHKVSLKKGSRKLRKLSSLYK